MNLIPSGDGESSLFLCVSVKALAFMVPRRGLEPPCLAATASKAVVSAISPPGQGRTLFDRKRYKKKRVQWILKSPVFFFYFFFFSKRIISVLSLSQSFLKRG